jgi:transposase
MAGQATRRLGVKRAIRKQLERVAKSGKTPQALAQRARIVLFAERGLSNYQIAKNLALDERTVVKWRSRFEARPKLSTLRDLPRSGRPATFTMDQRAEIVRIACSRPADWRLNFSAIWTFSLLKDVVESTLEVSISRSEVWRILQCHGVRPHRVHSWLHSTDPEFRPKVRAICDVYLNPPEGATVLSIDEKTGIGARQHKHPLRPANRTGDGREESEYIRHGTVTLIAAFNIKTGEVIGICDRRTGDNLVAFLEQLAVRYPTGPVYIVWDNLNVHTGERWIKFNERHGNRFHFLYTPKHGSWVNQVELWFSILQRRLIRHGSFKSRTELSRAILGFVTYWNTTEAHPFRWRFRGDFKDTSFAALAA